MAVRHVVAGGTKVSGDSTADDWTLANCYPTIATAIGDASIAAGDELILEHLGTYDITAMIAKMLGINGAYTIRGRFARVNNLAVPDCTVRGTSASGALFLFNDTVNRADIEFRDLAFTKSVTHTDASRPYILQAAQKTGDVTFSRCWIKDIVVSIAGASTYELGAINYASAPTLPATITLNGLTWQNISGTFGTGSGVLLFKSGNPAMTYNFTNIKLRTLSLNTGGAGRYIHIDGKLTLNGFDAEGLSGVSTKTDGGFGCILAKGATGFFHARNIKLKNILHTSAYCDAAFLVNCEHDVSNVLGINVVLDSLTHDGTGGIGCLVAAFNNKRGSTTRVRAYRCSSKFGTAVYYSNGAYGFVDTVWAEECSTANGIFYKGGNGAVAWSNLVAINNTQIDVIGDASAAFIFHGHNGGSSGDTRNCIIGLRNLIMKGNTYLGIGYPISFAYLPGAYKLDAVVRDIVCRDATPAGKSIRLGTGHVNLNMAGANLAGGIDNAGTGAVTESGTTNTDVVVVGGLSMNSELDDRWPVAYRVAV